MIKIILALLISMNLTSVPEVTVDRIEDNDIAVIEVYYKDEIKMVDVPTEDFNNPIADNDKIIASVAVGSFEWLDGNDWYQFKSYDDTVWWVLTTEEIGFTPEANKTYTLLYYDNGTTSCTECAEEFECECEVYDDIFLAIY